MATISTTAWQATSRRGGAGGAGQAEPGAQVLPGGVDQCPAPLRGPEVGHEVSDVGVGDRTPADQFPGQLVQPDQRRQPRLHVHPGPRRSARCCGVRRGAVGRCNWAGSVGGEGVQDLGFGHAGVGAVGHAQEQVGADVVDRPQVPGGFGLGRQVVEVRDRGRYPFQRQVGPGQRPGALVVAAPDHPPASQGGLVAALSPLRVQGDRQGLDPLRELAGGQLPGRSGCAGRNQLLHDGQGVTVGQVRGQLGQQPRPGLVQIPGRHRGVQTG